MAVIIFGVIALIHKNNSLNIQPKKKKLIKYAFLVILIIDIQSILCVRRE